jgi:small-conductance mechanosensitive channel
MKERVLKNKIRFSWVRLGLLLMTSIAALLWYMGVHETVIELLNSKELTIKIGKIKLTPYIVLKALFFLLILLWVAGKISLALDKAVSKVTNLKPNDRILLTKIINIFLYVIVFLVSLSVIGIDITTISVLGGAVGIGLGFGLQKIASNFISGIILLLEKTIEEGDLIELPNNISGFVRKIRARYTLLETYDGKEIMVPNEDFITSKVTNCTFSSKLGRMEINIGFSYDSDLRKIKNIILSAAKNHRLCSKVKSPDVYLLEFGSNTVNFKLHMWLDDITDGKFTATNDILFEVWEQCQKFGIKISHPQLEINLKNDGKI